MSDIPVHGRGASFNPPNRFEEIHVERAPEEIAQYFDDPEPDRKILTKFFLDHTKSILAKNDSPDLGFTYSINPYRGCEHGCIYCYARPSHEYLGFSAGVDFETKILVKHDAAGLLEKQFRELSWEPQVVLLSGNTDCYQPVERRLHLTRQCLEVFLKYRNPVSMITKNALVCRDVDVLKNLASQNLVFVIISVTTLSGELARKMEPRTSSPEKKLEAIEVLANNGIPVGVNVAPIIPGLNDIEIPSILQAASKRGATMAGHTLVRLPYAVRDLFLDWLHREFPDKEAKILNRIRGVREGKLTSSEFGKRMTGEGPLADAIGHLFDTSCAKYGLNRGKIRLSTDQFIHPSGSQLSIFS